MTNTSDFFYRLVAAGANLVTRHVDSLKELAKDYDIIMNCTGLGAKKLCQDRHMVPIGGQIIKVSIDIFINYVLTREKYNTNGTLNTVDQSALD